jgi:hypothetical protein
MIFQIPALSILRRVYLALLSSVLESSERLDHGQCQWQLDWQLRPTLPRGVFRFNDPRVINA